MAVGEGKSGANPGPATQHLVGQGPCALPGVRYGIGGRTEASAPTEALQGVQWAGDRKGRPYERVTRGAVRRADVGSELSAAGGRGSEVSEWPRSKFPASAVRQRRNFGHRNRVIRNTPAQRSRRTDCHSQCAHWLRNDMVFTRGAVQDRRATARVAPTEALRGVQWAGDRKGRPYGGLRGMCGLGIGPCGSFLTGREWYVSDFGGGG